MPPEATPLVEARGLAKHYRVRRGAFSHQTLRAVDGVDLDVQPGEALGIVGESGSGKSTIARMLLRLIDASAGEIRFDGDDITNLKGAELRQLRRRMQIVFQNPHSSLNARHTIFQAIAEPLVVQEGLSGMALRRRVEELLDVVSLPRPFLYRYPHELSGGQKQRVCIARAVSLHPQLLVLDEPTSALDVSVQAQILAFLQDLRTELGLTYVFISHNLAVVRALCDRVAVMYLGRIVEVGPTGDVFARPAHPYTEALLAAVPRLDGAGILQLTEGDVPSPSNIPPGCRFHTRCPRMQPGLCDRVDPPYVRPGADRVSACHFADEVIARNPANKRAEANAQL